MLKSFIQTHFIQINLVIGLIFIFLWLTKESKINSKSKFKLKEAERELKFKNDTAFQKSKDLPLRLSGIRIDGEAHEILGVRPDASENEIVQAYKKLMKQYHPDLVAKQDTQAWKDAQKIAEALNQAKLALISKKNRKL
jgi:DnaJ-class molecular chaperone